MHYVVNVEFRLLGTYRHRYVGWVVAYHWTHEPNVVQLVFGT